MNALARFFKFDQQGTTFLREVIAGLTTFTTMSYIVVVNPAILSNAGIPAGPSFVAPVIACVFGCTLMGLTWVKTRLLHSRSAGSLATNGRRRWRQSLLPEPSLFCSRCCDCGNW